MKKSFILRPWFLFASISALLVILVTLSFKPIALDQPRDIWAHASSRIQKFYYLHVKFDPNFTQKVPMSATPVDIVIPLVEKDIKSARFAIESLRNLLMHPVGKIFIIAPESPKIRQFASQAKVFFVLEDTLLPVFRKNPPKSGWYKQQYLKLAADQIVEQEHYLIFDSDTVMIRPQIFTRKGKTIFNVSDEFVLPRKKMVQEALKIQKFRNVDFVCHHMLFAKSKVKAMKAYLEKTHGKKWQDVLNELKTTADLSEYELYANFVDHFFPKEIKILPSRNQGLPSDRVDGIDAFRVALAQYCKTLSFHSFQTFSFLTRIGK